MENTIVTKRSNKMRKRIMLIICVTMLLGSLGTAMADVRVRGYYRRNGTYVEPHYKSDPDGNVWNNWSSYGNINPYTGKRGTRRVW